MTSASFHTSGKVHEASEQFIMSVRGANITGRQYLITRGFILSGPGNLLDGMDKMMPF